MNVRVTHGAALDRLAALEDERRFLLRSLADLEREREAGDIDEADYVTLRDGYTARAAAVLRAIEQRTAALPPRRGWKRSAVLAWVVGTVVVAVVAGILVARNSGQRLPASAAEQPINDVAALLVQGRRVMEPDPVLAKAIYERVLELEPDNVEARAYTGWLFYVLARNAGNADMAALAVEQARTSLAAAVEIDPTYPDAHCFLAIIALTYDGDVDTTRSEIDACDANDPPAQVRALVEEEVARVASGAEQPTTSASP